MPLQNICERIVQSPEAPLTEDELRTLLASFMGLPAGGNIARLSGKALFVGDIHGDLPSMLSAFRTADWEGASILFLEDIVDRGSYQMECANLLLSRMTLEPARVFCTRGNHEFKSVNLRWGFFDEVMARYSEDMFFMYNEAFKRLPLAALLDDRIFGIHGGVSLLHRTLASIEAMQHGEMVHRDERLDLLWNDPSEEHDGFLDNNKRGIFYTFGRDVFDRFMETNGLELFIRGHEEQKTGCKYFFDGRLISIFSSGDHYKDTVPSAVLVEPGEGLRILRL